VYEVACRAKTGGERETIFVYEVACRAKTGGERETIFVYEVACRAKTGGERETIFVYEVAFHAKRVMFGAAWAKRACAARASICAERGWFSAAAVVNWDVRMRFRGLLVEVSGRSSNLVG